MVVAEVEGGERGERKPGEKVKVNMGGEGESEN